MIKRNKKLMDYIKSPLTSFKRINLVSNVQKLRNKEYLDLRNKYLDSHPICEVCNTNATSEIHHKSGRIGENLFKNFCAVCRNCHETIHNNVKWAKENKLLL